MIIETNALWGEFTVPDYPATYTTYLTEPLPAVPDVRRPAVVICGGGSFTSIAPHEQEPVALAFAALGYQAFVLDYVTSSTGDVSYPQPVADLAKMVATVRAHADEWHVDPARVTVVGFSAGGFLCASLAACWKEGGLSALTGEAADNIRPDAAVLCYPALDFRVMRDEQTRDPRIDLRVPKTGGKTGRDLLNEYLAMVVGAEPTEERLVEVCPTTHVTRAMPPTFVWATADDRTCPISQVYDLAAALAREGVSHELHVFDRGGHGLSVANITTCAHNEEAQQAVRPWLELAQRFLARNGVAAVAPCA